MPIIDVYISCRSSDHESANRICDALRSNGLHVYVDQAVEVGQIWSKVIDETLRSARAVVALFSKESMQSAWFRDEAALARDMGKLIPIRLEAIELPLGFGQFHSLDLMRWEGDEEAPEFQYLLKVIDRMLGRELPRSTTESNESRGPSWRRQTGKNPELAGTLIKADPGRPYSKPMRAGFTSIFIAHAGSDKQRLKPIIEVLICAGYCVWIDRPKELGLSTRMERKALGISLGADWQQSISRAVKKSKVVLAFWSHDAVDGRRERFYYEIYMGLAQRKLVQCRLDEMPPEKIGLPFTFEQIADLKDFKLGVYNPQLDDLIGQVSNFKRRGA